MRILSVLPLVVACVASCDRSAARQPGSRETAAASRATTQAVAPHSTLAGGTVRGLPAAIRQGCEELQAVFAATALASGRRPPAAGPRDTSAIFGGLEDGAREAACYVAWADSAGGLPWDDLLARAKARGWRERVHLFSADGPDGILLAISRGEVACILDMRWEGDDDSDSTYVPPPGSSAFARCFADRPDRY